MKDDILRLRKLGKSYNEIAATLGCSKGAIAYHCGPGQKEKTLDRSRRNRKKTKTAIRIKIGRFLQPKVREFKLSEARNSTPGKAAYDSFYKKIISDPICYLTGRVIDLTKPKSYNLDHIHPLSKGGRGDLNNMGLACRDANMSKFDLTLSEYISLCKEVCENFGYKVVK